MTESLASMVGIEEFDDPAFETRRKTLLINGVQFAYALLCIREEYESVPDFASTRVGGLALQALSSEYALVLDIEFREPARPLEETLKHSRLAANRIATCDDQPLRIIQLEAGSRKSWLSTIQVVAEERLWGPLETYCTLRGTADVSQTAMRLAAQSLEMLVRKVITGDF